METTTASGAPATSASLTLTAPGPGKRHRVHWVSWYADAATTTDDVGITRNNGTFLARAGASPSNTPCCFSFPGGVVGDNNDQTKVVITVTGAGVGNLRVTAGYTLVSV